jgi:16S rRNA (adenine1518-N6/adenine1519-N6)-dimethyltransferase
LIDGNIVAKIIAEVTQLPRSFAVEIGSGPGVLTEALLDKGLSVVAVEKDDAFARALHRLDPSETKLRVVAADFLECPLEGLVGAHEARDVAVISNLPYHLTTPILQTLLEKSSLFSMAILMMQDEVAQRLTGGKASFLGHYAAFFTDVRYSFRVPKGCFWPKPKIDSAVVTFHVRPPLLPKCDHERFFELLRVAFAGRRKTVLHSLLKMFSREKCIAAFDRVGLSHSSRPEEISIHTWVALFQYLKT